MIVAIIDAEALQLFLFLAATNSYRGGRLCSRYVLIVCSS